MNPHSVIVNPIKGWHSKHRKVSRKGRFYLGLAIATMLSGSLPAQKEDVEEIYNLSPFNVDASQDDRYRSTNSTSGTSLDTRIMDLPMAIEVVNAAFIEDIGATDLDEALAYSSGVFLNDQSDEIKITHANRDHSEDLSPSSVGGVNGLFDNAIILRGFNVPFQNRDGFRLGGLIPQYGTIMGGIIDTSNVERMEVVRGPNSLLYGIGALSGMVNVIPKRPPLCTGSKSDCRRGE